MLNQRGIMQVININFKKYVMYYSAGYFGASVIIFAVLTFFDSNASASTLATVFAGAYIAVDAFIKDNRRALTKSEMWSLTWLSLISSILISCLSVFLILTWYIYFSGEVVNGSFSGFMQEVSKLPMSKGVMIAILIFVTLITLGTIRISYGFSNKILSKNINVNKI